MIIYLLQDHATDLHKFHPTLASAKATAKEYGLTKANACILKCDIGKIDKVKVCMLLGDGGYTEAEDLVWGTQP